MQNKTKKLAIKCPRCGVEIDWEGNDYRPFCSNRCLQIDLGAWVDEEYRVPMNPELPQDDFELCKSNDKTEEWR
jgi:hypothetical protein